MLSTRLAEGERGLEGLFIPTADAAVVTMAASIGFEYVLGAKHGGIFAVKFHQAIARVIATKERPWGICFGKARYRWRQRKALLMATAAPLLFQAGVRGWRQDGTFNA